MIRRSWRLFWFVLALAASSFAQAAEPEPVCDPGDPAKCATPMERGDTAPYSGQLLTPTLAIGLGQKADSCEKRWKLKLEHDLSLVRIQLDLETQKHQIDVEVRDQQIQLLTQRLKEATAEPWYEHPAFVSAAAVVITVAVTVAIFYAAVEIRNQAQTSP